MKKVFISLLLFLLVCSTAGLWGAGPQRAYAGVNNKLIKLVNTDKASYSPGNVVTVYVDLLNGTGSSFSGDVSLYFRYLGNPAGTNSDQTKTFTLNNGASTTVSFTWTAPANDFRGYLVEVWVRDTAGNIKDKGMTAVDVSSDWTRFPRYGYVSEFSDTTDAANRTWQLKNFHLNALQYYDWQHTHHQPNPNPADNEWQDIGNRWIARSTVNSFISVGHSYNIKAMNYNLINGAYDNYWGDGSGVQLAWGAFTNSRTSSDPVYTPYEQDQYIDLPPSWAGGFGKLYLFNPANTAWQNYINGQEAQVFANFGFDGWHVDSLGARGTADANGQPTLYDWDGAPFHLEDTYPGFLNAAKSYLNKPIVFNTVGAYGQDKISSDSNADFVYSELWDGIESNNDYIDLLKLAERSKIYSDKAVVFAAYMNRNYSKTTPNGSQREFKEPSVRLADAAMFASGAAHIELGDGEYMLSDEYFANKKLIMSDSLKDAMRNYYSFLVAYENLLRDKVSKGSNKVTATAGSYTSSPSGEAGKIWTISKAKDGYDIVHLINLTKNTSTRWRDDDAVYTEPDVLDNVSVKIYYEGSLASMPKVWWATPDSIGTDPASYQYGKANLLTQGSNWTTGSDANGSFITLTIPKLHYWDMIWIEKGANETSGSQVMLQDFESTGVGTLPVNWEPITASDAPAPLGGSWSVTQPAGSTKELTVGSGGGIIKYNKGLNTGNYSVEGHIYIPNAASNGSILARVQQNGGFYQLELKNGTSWNLYKYDGASWTLLGSGAFSYSAGYHYLKLSCVGNKLTVEVDLSNKGSYWDLNDPFLDGTVGARSEAGNHRFDNLKVTAL